jgi:hypothetical protein
MAFVLYSSAQGVDLIEEQMKRLARDETHATGTEGLKEANKGMTSVFVGAE